MDVPAVTPGYTTTEFWGKVIVQLVGLINTLLGLLALLGVIKYQQVAADPGLVQLLAGLLATIAPEIIYILGRSSVKKAHALAVVTANSPAGPFNRA